MKLLTFSLFALLSPAAVQGQDTQPECADWTQAHIFGPSPATQAASDAYVATVKASIEAQCFDAEGGISCDVTIPTDSAEAMGFMSTCYSAGGRMWTYSYSPLCTPIASTSETSVKPVMVCASASCISVGVQNLIPQPELAAIGCGPGTSILEMLSVDPAENEPCVNWTKMQLFDPNPAMKPAEDAYLEKVAISLRDSCIDPATNFTKPCDIGLVNNDAIGQTYYDECTVNGGKMYTYSLNAQCSPQIGQTPLATDAMNIAPVLFCASASCNANLAVLYPRQVEIYKYFDAIGVTCGSASDSSPTEYTPSNTAPDSGSGGDSGGSGSNPAMAGSWFGTFLMVVAFYFSKM